MLRGCNHKSLLYPFGSVRMGSGAGVALALQTRAAWKRRETGCVRREGRRGTWLAEIQGSGVMGSKLAIDWYLGKFGAAGGGGGKLAGKWRLHLFHFPPPQVRRKKNHCFTIWAILLTFILLKKNFIYLLYFWLHWVVVGARRLSLVAVSKGNSFLVLYGLLIAMASLVAECRLSRMCGLSSCGPWA